MAIIAHKPLIKTLAVKCPTGMPPEDQPECFYRGGSTTCENCLYPEFREKIEADNRRRNEFTATLKDEYRHHYGVR